MAFGVKWKRLSFRVSSGEGGSGWSFASYSKKENKKQRAFKFICDSPQLHPRHERPARPGSMRDQVRSGGVLVLRGADAARDLRLHAHRQRHG